MMKDSSLDAHMAMKNKVIFVAFSLYSELNSTHYARTHIFALRARHVGIVPKLFVSYEMTQYSEILDLCISNLFFPVHSI